MNLEFIEKGRFSDNDMSEIYGGGIYCGTYKVCSKQGKSSCLPYFHCENMDDWTTLKTCNNFSWVATFEEDFEVLALPMIQYTDL